jgi:8-oxo-dGTP diphosphatase
MGKKEEKSIAVAIFSQDRKKVLLIKRRDVPVWVLPGGGIERDEPPEKAAIRELEEETGFQAKVTRFVGEYFPINRLAKHTYLYECSIIGGRASRGKETKDLDYFPIEKLPSLLPPPYQEWIFDAHFVSPHPFKKELKSVNYKTFFKNLLLHPLLIFRFLMARCHLHIND